MSVFSSSLASLDLFCFGFSTYLCGKKFDRHSHFNEHIDSLARWCLWAVFLKLTESALSKFKHICFKMKDISIVSALTVKHTLEQSETNKSDLIEMKWPSVTPCRLQRHYIIISCCRRCRTETHKRQDNRVANCWHTAVGACAVVLWLAPSRYNEL